MVWEAIAKSPADRNSANMPDYEAARREFSWEDARRQLDWLPGGGLNIAHEAVCRHADGPEAGRIAIRWLARDGASRDVTYAELAALSARFANVLSAHGCGRGDRLFCLIGRQPELYLGALGALRAGLTFSPLFSAFGPEPIRSRMEIGSATVLLTTEALYRRKAIPWRAELPSLKLVLLAGCEGEAPEGCVALGAALERASDSFETVATRPEDMALIHFTSGTTGKPKGAVHAHEAVVAHAETGRVALDLRPGDIYWCTADPGWVTGTSYGIVSPLVNGVTMIVDEADFDAERWYRILDEQKVDVWYTAPTAIRMLMKTGAELTKGHDFSRLRFMASVGEPLNPEGVVWGQEVFGRPFHDNWWQTETGGIMIANYRSMEVRPGSMGKPLPGIEAAVIGKGEDGHLREVAPGAIGELALRPGWPSMMRAYLNEEARYGKCFADGWYLSGDLALRDGDGYFWFVGRADDLIKSSGHLIGPFEVESALMEHATVAEAGVIGIPDETAGEVVKAYVALKSGFEPSEALEREIRGHARKRLGPAVAPREIVFRKTLPKTRSGKIMRRLLKARELGLPEGDISTLETDET
jgi:acetyl-CoA synthetase